MIDACCTVTPSQCGSTAEDLSLLTTTSSHDIGHGQLDNIRVEQDLERPDSARTYENVSPLPTITSHLLTPGNWGHSLQEVTSPASQATTTWLCCALSLALEPASVAAEPSHPAGTEGTTWLLYPGDGGVVRKASSSSSTSSVCDDSVLELCTASSRCSSCSAAVGTPFGDAPSPPDSGNGSYDAGVEQSRLSRFVSPDRDRVRTPGRSSYSVVASFLPEWDAERLDTVYTRLSQCGFYYGRMTMDGAAERLRHSSVGTFLLRDSTDERYLFSLSVETCRGTTSIRIVYHSGLFRLDCSSDQDYLLPTFDCALRLVTYYVCVCSGRTTGIGYVFLESTGRRDTPVLLRRPLYWRVNKLAHLARRAVHRALSRRPSRSESDRSSVIDRLQLVPSLKCYLKEYPYEL